MTSLKYQPSYSINLSLFLIQTNTHMVDLLFTSTHLSHTNNTKHNHCAFHMTMQLPSPHSTLLCQPYLVLLSLFPYTCHVMLRPVNGMICSPSSPLFRPCSLLVTTCQLLSWVI